jgi:hypothetical protein
MRNADQCSYFYSFFILDQTHLKTVLHTEYAFFLILGEMYLYCLQQGDVE